MKQHEEETFEGESCYLLHSALTNHVFTSIMNLETANQIWDETTQKQKSSEKESLTNFVYAWSTKSLDCPATNCSIRVARAANL